MTLPIVKITPVAELPGKDLTSPPMIKSRVQLWLVALKLIASPNVGFNPTFPLDLYFIHRYTSPFDLKRVLFEVPGHEPIRAEDALVYAFNHRAKSLYANVEYERFIVLVFEHPAFTGGRIELRARLFMTIDDSDKENNRIFEEIEWVELQLHGLNKDDVEISHGIEISRPVEEEIPIHKHHLRRRLK